jgi:hypothetical protein
MGRVQLAVIARLVHVSEIEGPISAWQPIPVIILSDILVDGVRTFAGLY